MAFENRRRGGFGGRGGGRNDDRGMRGGRGGGRFGSSERERSPMREDRLGNDRFRDDRGRGDRMHDDRMRDDRVRDDRIRDDRGREPFREPFRGRGIRPLMPPGRDFEPRDPYNAEPFRQGFSEPWFEDDPYRQEPFPDQYRDPFRNRAPPPPPPECEIFVVGRELLEYGKAVERKVKEHNILTAVSVLPEDRTPQQLVEDLTGQNALYAVFINPQNEIHRSVTLNILHGTPQEHRNMPLDDAIALVGRSFVSYVEGLREKTHGTAAPQSSASRIFLPPTPEVTYLLNLLADNRVVTIAELDTVIKYLQERRDKLIDAERRPVLTDATVAKISPQLAMDYPQSSSSQEMSAPVISTDVSTVAAVHQDLTSKILNLFTGNIGGIQGVPPANGTPQQAKLPSGTPAPAPQPPITAPSSASLINFDNPNVQKALDNLIQNTSLLKNINTKVSLPSPQTGTPSIPSTLGAMNSMYGQGGGGGMAPDQSQLQSSQNMAANFMSGFVGYQGQQGLGGQGNIVQGNPGQVPQNSYGMPGQGMQGAMGGGQGMQGAMGGTYGGSYPY